MRAVCTHNSRRRVRFPSFRSIPKVTSSLRKPHRTTSVPVGILSRQVPVVQTREIRDSARTEASETDRANAKRRLLRFLRQSEEGGSSPRDDERARKRDGLSSPDRATASVFLFVSRSANPQRRTRGRVLWKLRRTVTCHDHGSRVVRSSNSKPDPSLSFGRRSKGIEEPSAEWSVETLR